MNIESSENEGVVQGRAEWQQPRWNKLDAKEAEISTNSNSDGPLSS